MDDHSESIAEFEKAVKTLEAAKILSISGFYADSLSLLKNPK